MTLYEENILDNLKSYIETGLATHLAAIEQQEGDGVRLPDLRKIVIGEADIFKLNRYPAMLLFPEEIVYNDLHTRADSLDITIAGIVVVKGAKTENLVTKVTRYIAAIRYLIDADRTLSAAVDNCYVERVRYSARPPGAEDFMVTEIIFVASKEVIRP